MATATHIPTTLMKAQGGLVPNQTVAFTSGIFVCGIVTNGSGANPAAGLPPLGSSGVQFTSDILRVNSELSFTGYARQTLAGLTWAFDANGTSVDWSFSNITFAQNAADPGTGRYGFISYTSSGSNDSNNPVVAVLDFGQTVSTVNGSLVLQSPAGGLIQFTGGG